jgi:hypothetical protein
MIIPFRWELLSFHGELINALFFPIINRIADLFGIELLLKDLSSDSKAFFLLFGIILFISLIVAAWIVLRTSPGKRSGLEKFTRQLASYYLALILMKYGLDKILKTQFYLPEPNILFTPLGKLDKDILFWSTMGTSYSYNLFMGIAEIIPSLLLLIPRTRTLGALIASSVLINVVAINFSFDISVKLFSSFLLITSLFLTFPVIATLIRNVPVKVDENTYPMTEHRKSLRILLTCCLFTLFFAEGLYPITRIETWNDDHAERPYLHGAYECIDRDSEIKRIFVHRDGYLIFQDKQDNFADFKLDIDQRNGNLNIQDYDMKKTVIPYRTDDASNTLRMVIQGKETEFRSLEWEELPLLKDRSHWTVD